MLPALYVNKYLVLNNIITFKRRFGDEYFFNIVSLVCNTLEKQNILFDFQYGIIRPSFENRNQPKKNLVIFHYDCIKDVEILLNKLATQSLYDKILLFSAQLDSTHVQSHKYQIINWGSDLLFQQHDYQNLEGQLTKSFDSDKHWISITGHPRIHRIIACILLKGLGWDQFGDIRFNPCTMHDFSIWNEFIDAHNTYSMPDNDWDHLFERGYELIKTGPYVCNGLDRQQIYDLNRTDNARNFDLRLRLIYKETAVEIVNETTSNHPGTHCTEKFLNSVYGFNIPIVLGPKGVVRYLEDLGFDMFRDIVDHSYDEIESPGYRILLAILKNKTLLTEKQKCIEVWQQLYPRLMANYEFAKKHLHTSCKKKTLEKFSDALYWLKE